MKIRNLAYAGLKVFSIYIFILSLRSLLGALNMWIAYTGKSFGVSDSSHFGIVLVVFGFINVGIILQIGLYIWFKTEKILAKIIPGSEAEDSSDKPEKFDTEGLLQIGFILIGVSILVNAIPDFIIYIAQVVRYVTNSLEIRLTEPRTLELIIEGIGSLVYIIFGLFLTFGAKKTLKIIGNVPKDLVKLVRKVRRD